MDHSRSGILHTVSRGVCSKVISVHFWKQVHLWPCSVLICSKSDARLFLADGNINMFLTVAGFQVTVNNRHNSLLV